MRIVKGTHLTRRQFMKFTAAMGAGVVVSGLTGGKRSLRAEDVPQPAMIIDLSRCTGCQSCVTACKVANDTVFGSFLTRVEKHVIKEDGKARPSFLPIMCIHCTNAPCIKACKHGAVVRLSNGIVTTDWSLCKADGDCMDACPYGARVADSRFDLRADSCDLCFHRLQKGLLPACVDACPSRARIFGYLNSPSGEFLSYLKKGPLLTPYGHPLDKAGARVFYVGSEKLTSFAAEALGAFEATSAYKVKKTANVPRSHQHIPADERTKGVTTVHSACLACNARCGIKAMVKDGRLEEIKGNPYHPYNTLGRPIGYDTPLEQAISEKGKATVCAKAVDSISYIYNPYRVLLPLKRAGKRGEGRFEPISWQQLIKEISHGGRLFAHLGEDRVVSGLSDLDSDEPIDPADPYLGPKRNGFVFISGRLQPGRKAFINRFVRSAFGSANRISHTDICGLGFRMGNFVFTEGKQVEMKADPWNAKYVLVFGSNIYSALQPGINTYGAAISERSSRGEVSFSVVDPRGHAATAHARRWVAVRPGHDGAFAMGMIRWIIENKAYNEDYLSAPNLASAARLGNGAYCNASHLVIAQKGHPDFGKFLRLHHVYPKAPESEREGFMVFEKEGGEPVHFESTGHALFDEARTITLKDGSKVMVKTAFRLMKESVMSHELSHYARLSGVEVKEIAQIAREFSSHGPHAAVCQYHGAGNYVSGTYAAFAVAALNALVGSVQRKGGYMTGGGRPGTWKKGLYDLINFPGRKKPRGVKISREKATYEKSKEYRQKLSSKGSGYPAKRPWFPFSKGGLCVETLSGIDQGYPYKCKVLFTYFFNPVYSIPGGYRFAETLKDEKKVPLHVSIDIGINESNIFADYIVPDVTFAEGHYAWLHPHAPSQRFCALRTPVIKPLTGKTDDGRPFCLETLFIDLAEELKLPGFGKDAIPSDDGRLHSLHQAEDFYLRGMVNVANNARVKKASEDEVAYVERAYPVASFKDILPKDEWEMLCYALARGGVFVPQDNLFEKERFKYGIKRVVLYNEKLASTRNSLSGKSFSGTLFLCVPTDSTGRPIDELDRDYPFHLVTHKMNIHTQSRTIWHKVARQIVPENKVVMHTEDAEKLGIKEGDRVRLISPSNKQGVSGKATLTPLIRRGCVSVSNHYGHSQLGASSIFVKDGAKVFLGGTDVIAGNMLKADPALSKGLTPNKITRLDEGLANTPLVDPVGGIPDFSSTRVKVERVS